MLLAEPLIPFARRVEFAGIVRVDAGLLVVVDQRRIDDLQGFMGAQVFANVGVLNEYVFTWTQAFDSTLRRVNLYARILRWMVDGLLCCSKTLTVGASVARARRRLRFHLGKSTLEPVFETFHYLLPMVSTECSLTVSKMIIPFRMPDESGIYYLPHTDQDLHVVKSVMGFTFFGASLRRAAILACFAAPAPCIGRDAKALHDQVGRCD